MGFNLEEILEGNSSHFSDWEQQQLQKLVDSEDQQARFVISRSTTFEGLFLYKSVEQILEEIKEELDKLGLKAKKGSTRRSTNPNILLANIIITKKEKES